MDMIVAVDAVIEGIVRVTVVIVCNDCDVVIFSEELCNLVYEILSIK